MVIIIRTISTISCHALGINHTVNSAVFDCQTIGVGIGRNTVVQIVGRNHAVNSSVINDRVDIAVVIAISCIVVPTYITIIVNVISIGGVVVVMKSIVSLTRNIVGRCISLRGDSQSASQC